VWRRLFTRDDGRERIAVPFWPGILSLLGAILIGFVVAFVAMVVLVIVVVLTTGATPTVKPGHPLETAGELLFYATAGAFAWSQLRPVRRGLLRRPSAGDLRAIAIGIAALFAMRIAMAVVLVVSHQTKHVQSGFEHFDVVTKVPAITIAGAALTFFTMVIVAPVVEEIGFRGLLFGALAPRLGVLGSAVVTALLFGAMHGDWVLFPVLAGLGFVGALAYASTRNLFVPIALHALNNALGTAFLLASSLRHHA
jgi:membrane protease YdiL (CAAX protease family)